MIKLVFNTSMPRAGSECLNAILSENPRIYGSTTSPLLEYMFAARGNYGLAEVRSQDPELMHKAFTSMTASMAQGYYAPITDRPVVVDKNRGWSHYFGWVAQWNPEPKMICMVRDLRSIVASLERIYRANRHTPEGPDNPSQMMNMTVGQRAHHWLTTQPVGLALQRTADSFQTGLAEKLLFVRYEDLCSSPQPTLDRVYDFIGEPRFEHDFKNIQKRVFEDDSHFGIFGRHQVSPTLRPLKPGDWQDVLPQEVSDSIYQNNQWFFEAFNYHKQIARPIP